jgi:diacylglycerol kinase family enzyme
LIHNESAGPGVYTGGDLVRLLRDSGHEVQLFTQDDASVARAIATRPDVIVASGGDGTVAKTAIALRDSSIPLYILPTGTSNNIARAVGADASIPTLVSRLVPSAPSMQLDIGRVTADGRDEYFVEAVGAGFLGAALEEQRRPLLRLVRWLWDIGVSPADRWERGLKGLSRLVRRLPARQMTIHADGEDVSGEYIVLEVMNITAIGPRIELAPGADAGDARLDLVVVRAADREALADYILRGSGHAKPPITTRRVRHVAVDWPDRHTHVDDAPWPNGSTGTRPRRVSIEIAGAAQLLVAGVRAA